MSEVRGQIVEVKSYELPSFGLRAKLTFSCSKLEARGSQLLLKSAI